MPRLLHKLRWCPSLYLHLPPSPCNREAQISLVLKCLFFSAKDCHVFPELGFVLQNCKLCNTLDKDQSCFRVFNFYSQGLTCSQTWTAICFTQTPHLSLSVPGSDRAGSALLCWVFRKAWGACFCPWLFSRSTPQRLGVQLASSDPGVWLYSSIHFLATRSANGEGLVQVRLFWALGVKKKSRTPTSRSPSLCQRSQTTFEAMMVHDCLHLKAVRRKD